MDKLSEANLAKHGINIDSQFLDRSKTAIPAHVGNVIDLLLDFNGIIPKKWQTSKRLEIDSKLKFHEDHCIRPPAKAFWGNNDPKSPKIQQRISHQNKEIWECIDVTKGFKKHQNTLEDDLTDRYKLGVFRSPEQIYLRVSKSARTDWIIHRNVPWTGRFFCGNDSDGGRIRLSYPKPDLFYGLRMIRSVVDDLIPKGSHDQDIYQCRNVCFLADIGSRLNLQTSITSAFSEDNVVDNLTNLARGQLDSHHTTCFPFAVVELKKQVIKKEDVEKCYGQAANAAARALSQYDNLFKRTLWKDDDHCMQELPPLVVFTCIGPDIKVWLMYAERNCPEFKPEMRCIYSTSVLILWGVISIRHIIKNMLKRWSQVYVNTLTPALVKARTQLRLQHAMQTRSSVTNHRSTHQPEEEGRLSLLPEFADGYTEDPDSIAEAVEGYVNKATQTQHTHEQSLDGKDAVEYPNGENSLHSQTASFSNSTEQLHNKMQSKFNGHGRDQTVSLTSRLSKHTREAIGDPSIASSTFNFEFRAGTRDNHSFTPASIADTLFPFQADANTTRKLPVRPLAAANSLLRANIDAGIRTKRIIDNYFTKTQYDAASTHLPQSAVKHEPVKSDVSVSNSMAEPQTKKQRITSDEHFTTEDATRIQHITPCTKEEAICDAYLQGILQHTKYPRAHHTADIEAHVETVKEAEDRVKVLWEIYAKKHRENSDSSIATHTFDSHEHMGWTIPLWNSMAPEQRQLEAFIFSNRYHSLFSPILHWERYRETISSPAILHSDLRGQSGHFAKRKVVKSIRGLVDADRSDFNGDDDGFYYFKLLCNGYTQSDYAKSGDSELDADYDPHEFDWEDCGSEADSAKHELESEDADDKAKPEHIGEMVESEPAKDGSSSQDADDDIECEDPGNEIESDYAENEIECEYTDDDDDDNDDEYAEEEGEDDSEYVEDEDEDDSEYVTDEDDFEYAKDEDESEYAEDEDESEFAEDEDDVEPEDTGDEGEAEHEEHQTPYRHAYYESGSEDTEGTRSRLAERDAEKEYKDRPTESKHDVETFVDNGVHAESQSGELDNYVEDILSEREEDSKARVSKSSLSNDNEAESDLESYTAEESQCGSDMETVIKLSELEDLADEVKEYGESLEGLANYLAFTSGPAAEVNYCRICRPKSSVTIDQP